MTKQEFLPAIQKLVNTYGKSYFGDQRVDMIWSEVKDLSHIWFSKFADYWISNERQAPLPKDFREATGRERERLYAIEKEKHKKEVQEFTRNISDEETSLIIKTIIKRMNGQVSDEEWEGVKAGLDNIAKMYESAYHCTKCLDTGLETYFDGKYENRRLCSC